MIKIRDYEPLDEDFIYHSWLASVDYNIPGVKQATRLVIDSCVKDATILIAASEEDEDHILGWLAYTEELGFPTLLYIFVKKRLRHHGIGHGLVRHQFPDGGPIPSAFWSFWCQKFSLKKKWSLKFNSLYLPALVDRLHAKANSEARDSSKAECPEA